MKQWDDLVEGLGSMIEAQVEAQAAPIRATLDREAAGIETVAALLADLERRVYNIACTIEGDPE